MGALVQVASFEYPWEAYVAQGRLEAHGIKCFIFDDGIVTANPFITNAVGGVKLMVDRADAEDAIKLLREKVGDEDIDFVE